MNANNPETDHEETFGPEQPSSTGTTTQDPEGDGKVEEAGIGSHQPVSSPGGSTTGPEGEVSETFGEVFEESAEATEEDETLVEGIESIEGYDPHYLSELAELIEEGGEEAAEEKDEFAEAIDAYFASLDDTSQEFFGALLPALAPLIGQVGKAVVGGIGSAIKRRRHTRGRRLVRCPVPRRRESGGEEAGTVLEVVIGEDDRKRIQQTNKAPWNGICQLGIRTRTGRRYFGTGWLISPRVVITAGHCVYLHKAGGWASSIDVSAGRDGNKRPYGTVTAKRFTSVNGWVKNRSRNSDYGAIILDKPFPNVGSSSPLEFTFAALNDDQLSRKVVNLSGYPADAPGTGKDGTKQWFHARRVDSVTSKTIVYDIDTGGGQSGSPVWVYDRKKRQRQAVGIHTNGFFTGNSATRITNDIANNLNRWKLAGGS